MLRRSHRCLNWCALRWFSTGLTFNLRAIESKWKALWPNLLQSSEEGEKFYCLVQFPYPSGNLHIGHARVYYISDTIARYNRLRGKKVIHPIGWDSFGLPAENAAISRRINPRVWTQQNIRDMKEQLMKLGVWFDWERQLATHEPEYYKQTQRIFLELFRNGLAYKKQAEVNWDPVDQTVLANEQVDINGNSWRSGAKVEKKRLSQWFFRITAYSKELNEDLAILEKWPERVKQMQAGWIGVKEGYKVSFKITDHNDKTRLGTMLEIFTTRVETIMGCTFVAVPTKNSEGKIMGQCVHPLSGAVLPIYEADYVAEDFGTGAIMGVPAHDDNDKKFAEKFNIPLKTILSDDGTTLINSQSFTGLSLANARKLIEEELKVLALGESHSQTHLRDWLVSRQRYWGAPIPIVYCKDCGIQPVPQSNLPVLLPRSDLSEGNPLFSDAFKSCRCPRCNGEAKRESDTLDTFVDSSWYFLRYLSPKDQQVPFSKQAAEKALPVDVYIGGIEHAVMHLLYARFIHKVLHKHGFIGNAWRQPFKELIVQGLVKGRSYRIKSTGKYITPEEAQKLPNDQLIVAFEKMSKSKFNGVNPTDIVERYGCDPLRAAMMFSAPVQKDIEFTEEEVERMRDFLLKVVRLGDRITGGNKKVTQKLQEVKMQVLSNDELGLFEKIIRLVEDIENALEKSYAMHVYAARVMEMFNIIRDASNSTFYSSGCLQLAFKILVVSITPLSPHAGYQLWSMLPTAQSTLESQVFPTGASNQMIWPNIESLRSHVKDYSLSDVLVSKNNKFVAKIRLSSSLLEESIANEQKKAQLLVTLLEDGRLKHLSTLPLKKVLLLKTARAYLVNILTV